MLCISEIFVIVNERLVQISHLKLQMIHGNQRNTIYSTKNRSITMRGVTGMVKMVTQDLHIPVTRQDRL